MKTQIVIASILCSTQMFAQDRGVDFAQDIQPIFKTRCYSCHDARKQTAGLRLDVRANVMRGGESGEKGIVPHKLGESELLNRVQTDDGDLRMPPKGEPLTKAQIGLLRAWIETGAKWPDNLAGFDASKDHWAFQPPKKTPLPKVKNEKWIQNEIDRFVLAKLDAEDRAPNKRANRLKLLRRLHLDLIGLPPTLDYIDWFEKEYHRDSNAVFRKAVERLLKSPHYGERWGRHWRMPRGLPTRTVSKKTNSVKCGFIATG